MQLTEQLQEIYSYLIGDFIDTVRGHSKKNDYSRYAFYGVLSVLLCIVMFIGYQWYTIQREKSAQKALAECFDQHDRALSGDGAVSWKMMAAMWQRAHDEHAWSALAPYFLIYKSESLLQNGNIAQAVTVLQEALAGMSSSSPLYYIYKTKEVLMNGALAGQEESVVDGLTALGYDKKNSQRDVALYYLGLYHWVHDNLNDATLAWQELSNMGLNAEAVSPWAQQIEERLKQLYDSGYPRSASQAVDGIQEIA